MIDCNLQDNITTISIILYKNELYYIVLYILQISILKIYEIK